MTFGRLIAALLSQLSLGIMALSLGHRLFVCVDQGFGTPLGPLADMRTELKIPPDELGIAKPTSKCT